MNYKRRYMAQKRFLQSLFASIILTFFLQHPQTAVGATQLPPSWPSEQSDLKPDPSLLRGILDNGLRYVIKKNREPAERVAMYLNIQSGSLHETEEQRGVAHFLEHLMFNGSTHFPPGSLVDYFQSAGMNFGTDTNAHTSFNETVYRIFLPNGSPEQVDKMLLVMADYAGGALLLDSEIDRERGVIFAEKRARDSASYRAHLASSSYSFRGTLYPERMVIGTEDVLATADSSLLRAFYETWYRPDNMVLVIVGDVDPPVIEKLVIKQFSTLRGKGPLPEQPDFKKLEHKGLDAFYHYEAELGQTTVSIGTFWDTPLVSDSLKFEKGQLTRIIGALIMQYRLQRLQEEDDQPFSNTSFNSGHIIDRIGYGSISAKTNEKGWKESLKTLDEMLRQAIQFGFQNIEFERVKKVIISSLDSAVLTSKTQDSRNIGRSIIDNLNSNRVYQSPEQEQELYTEMLRSLTVDDVNRVFREVWQHENRLISVTGDTRLGENGRREIIDLYKHYRGAEVVASIGQQIKKFPYLPISDFPKLEMKVEDFPKIDAESVIFSNGVVVHLKKTAFQENSFQFTAGFGNGRMAEPVPGMALLAERVVNGSGSKRLTLSDIEEILAGNSVDMRFRMGDTLNYWAGQGLKKDFGLFVQLLHTMLFDVGFRENVFNTVLANVELMYQRLNRDIAGAIPLTVQSFLAGYNPRFGLPAWETISNISFNELADWVDSTLQISKLEISIVGDFDRDEVIQQLGKYFGTAVMRNGTGASIPRITFPAGKDLVVPVNTSIEKSLVLIAWPTDDFWDITRTRRLNILADIFEDRVRKVIREKQGATYSPSVASSNSKVYKGYGFIFAQLTIMPGSEDVIVEEIKKISSDLLNNGVTEEELERVRKPTIASLEDRVKTNDYWLKSVLFNSSRYPQQLEWPEGLIADFSAITVAELDALAKEYFQLKNVATIKVVPAAVEK